MFLFNLPDELRNVLGYEGASDFVICALLFIAILIVLLCIFSALVSIFLAVKYIKFNRRQNSLNLTGEEICRNNLDANGLEHIKVKKTGSLLFGNSYSHYFKKVRLRRLTWHKKSETAMAMAYQKSELAVLDKINDKDMSWRVKITPIIYFGPIAFLPMVLIGLVLDFLIFATGGLFTIILTLIGLLFYVLSFVMSIMVLKTEIKAQKMALESMKRDGVTDDEIADCKELFRLYNIEYINDLLMALLELIYKVLQIVASAQSNNSSTFKD